MEFPNINNILKIYIHPKDPRAQEDYKFRGISAARQQTSETISESMEAPYASESGLKKYADGKKSYWQVFREMCGKLPRHPCCSCGVLAKKCIKITEKTQKTWKAIYFSHTCANFF